MPALPVVSDHGVIVGMLHLRDVQQALKTNKDVLTPASELIDPHSFQGPARIDESLETAIQRGSRQLRQIPVADQDGYLLGILDLDSMLVRAELATSDLRNQKHEASVQPDELMDPQTSEPLNVPSSSYNVNHFDQTN